MRRKSKDAPPSRIWTWGCLPPQGESLARVDEQLRLATKYWNTLVPIELDRRRAVRKAMAGHIDIAPLAERIADAEHEMAALRTALKARRQAAKARGGVPPERARIRELTIALKGMREALKAAKARVKSDPAVAAAIEAADERAAAAIKAAREAIVTEGLYWGTYLLVEKSMEQARSGSMDPNYHEWTGSGRVGVQIQKGMPASRLFDGEDQRIRIVPRSGAPLESPAHLRTLQSRRHLMLRAGSDDSRGPIWIEADMVVHRMPPKDAVVKWAWLLRRRVGRRFRYELQAVLESRTFVAPSEPTGNDTAAIDIGWRIMDPSSLRVAYVVDTAGRGSEIRMPADVVDRLAQVDSLRSTRDGRFDEAKAMLASFLGSCPKVPDGLREAARFLSAWKSHERLLRLVEAWESRRFDGDELVFAALREWRRKEMHLHDWEANQRAKALGRRKDFYRNVARAIAVRFRRVVLEIFDLRRMARRPAPEGEAAAPKTQRRNRHHMALSEFRGALKAACALTGTEIVEVPAEWTTIDCTACGARLPWDPAPKVDHRCAGCGRLWDQDWNAGANLLRLGGETPPPERAGQLPNLYVAPVSVQARMRAGYRAASGAVVDAAE